MHVSGDASLHDLDWNTRRWNGTQAYCDSKLFVTALALAIARRWPTVISHAVDPGWVPTRMGGPSASDDLDEGHLTQTWLAVSHDTQATRSGQVWHHHQPAPVADAARWLRGGGPRPPQWACAARRSKPCAGCEAVAIVPVHSQMGRSGTRGLTS